MTKGLNIIRTPEEILKFVKNCVLEFKNHLFIYFNTSFHLNYKKILIF